MYRWKSKPSWHAFMSSELLSCLLCIIYLDGSHKPRYQPKFQHTLSIWINASEQWLCKELILLPCLWYLLHPIMYNCHCQKDCWRNYKIKTSLHNMKIRNRDKIPSKVLRHCTGFTRCSWASTHATWSQARRTGRWAAVITACLVELTVPPAKPTLGKLHLHASSGTVQDSAYSPFNL